MEKAQTLIEFVKSENPLTLNAQTWDISTLCLVVLVCIFALTVVSLVIRVIISRLKSKNLILGNSKALFTNLVAIMAITVAVSVGVFATVAVSTAFAGNLKTAQASDKVLAFVNEDTGEVTIDNGFLNNNKINDLYVIEVNVEYLDDIKIVDECLWQVDIDNQTAYKNHAGMPSLKLGIKVGSSETKFMVSNLSAQTAKTLIGKTVAKVTFFVDNFNSEQIKAFEELDKFVDEANSSISKIPENLLLDEDRKSINDKISKIKDEYEIKIAETTDADQLQELLKAVQDDIDKLLKEAEAMVSAATKEKQDFIDQAKQTINNFKEQLNSNIWLSEEQKSDFSSCIDTFESNLPNIDKATSHKDLDTFKNNMSSDFSKFQTDLENQTAQAKADQISSAKTFVDSLISAASEAIEKIDNLTSATKSTYKDKLDTLKNAAYNKLDKVTSPAEIDTITSTLSSDIDAVVAEANAKAHRSWILENWEPETSYETSANSSFEIEEIAAVSSEDPFKSDAPYPTYFIDSDTNNDYFSIETTEEHKAKILVAEGTPDDTYSVIVYAQFVSVPDKGYIAISNKVALTVTVFTEEPFEVELDNKEGYPLTFDDWHTGDYNYVLSDGGTEILNAEGQPGYYVNFYFYSTDPDGTYGLDIREGHWENIFFQKLNNDSYDPLAAGGGYSLLLTDEIFEIITTSKSWGGTFVLHGDNVVCEKLTLSIEKIFDPPANQALFTPDFFLISPYRTHNFGNIFGAFWGRRFFGPVGTSGFPFHYL